MSSPCPGSRGSVNVFRAGQGLGRDRPRAGVPSRRARRRADRRRRLAGGGAARSAAPLRQLRAPARERPAIATCSSGWRRSSPICATACARLGRDPVFAVDRDPHARHRHRREHRRVHAAPRPAAAQPAGQRRRRTWCASISSASTDPRAGRRRALRDAAAAAPAAALVRRPLRLAATAPSTSPIGTARCGCSRPRPGQRQRVRAARAPAAARPPA